MRYGVRASALLHISDPEVALDFDLALAARARQTTLDRIADEVGDENFFGLVIRLLMELV